MRKMFEIFYPHLEIIFWIAVLAAFFSIIATWFVGMDYSIDDKVRYIFEVIAICSIIGLYFVGCAMLDRVDQNLAVEKHVVIGDKWNNSNNYYFADVKGNIYTMEYDFRDKEKTTKYSKLLRTRYKSLEIGKEYTIESFNRANNLMSVREV